MPLKNDILRALKDNGQVINTETRALVDDFIDSVEDVTAEVDDNEDEGEDD